MLHYDHSRIEQQNSAFHDKKVEHMDYIIMYLGPKGSKFIDSIQQ